MEVRKLRKKDGIGKGVMVGGRMVKDYRDETISGPGSLSLETALIILFPPP